MSRFEIDFIRPQSDIFVSRVDPTIKAEITEPLPSIGIAEFKDALTKFARSLTPEDNALYDMARISAKTTKNNKDCYHIWDTFSKFYLDSIRKTFPDKDKEFFLSIEKQIKDIDISILKKEDVDNRVFAVYLIGLLEGLL